MTTATAAAAPALDIRDSILAIRGFSARVARRARAAGIPLDRDDIEQEAAVAWTRAARDFDPARGVPFGFWLESIMRNHLNKVMSRLAGDRVSVTERVDYDDEASIAGLGDVLSVAPDAESAIVRSQSREAALARLSPDARRVVEWLEHPPRFLVEAHAGLQARAAWGRERGLASTAPRTITIAFVMEALGFDQRRAARARRDLDAVASLSD